MNKDLIKNSTKEILYKFSVLTALVISIYACSDFNPLSCIAAAVFASLIFVIRPDTSLLPVYMSFLISLFLSKTVGQELTLITFMISGIIILFSGNSETIKKAVSGSEFAPAMMLSVALTMTVLITTDYFGIGAEGNTVINMIKSYVSLGFHPNWRGILYGTIVMVVMITFPRKFRTGTKIVSASLMAVLIVYFLNMFLIPEGTVSPIALLEKPAFEWYSLRSLKGDFSLTVSNVIYVIVSAFALSASFIITDTECTRRDNISRSVAAFCIPVVAGYFIPGKLAKKKIEYICGGISAILIVAVMLITGGFCRIPVSGCAVVLIVGAWQAVDFSLFRKVFGSVKSVIIFIAVIAITLLTNISIGTVSAVIICALNEKFKAVKAKKSN